MSSTSAQGTQPTPLAQPTTSTTGTERERDSAGRTAARLAGRTAARAARGTRQAIRRNPQVDRAYRAGVGVVGGTTVALGVVLIPLPGPGSLVALGGLGILATEFEGAKKASRRANTAAARAVGAARDARRRRQEQRPDR